VVAVHGGHRAANHSLVWVYEHGSNIPTLSSWVACFSWKRK
jgi:hypothetical protein